MMLKCRRPEMGRWAAVIGILIVSTVLATTTAGASPHQAQTSLADGWTHLLVAFVEHDARAKAFVDTTAQASKEPAVRGLAAVLLQEWELSPNTDVLTHPRSVYVPKLTPRNEQARAETFLLKVSVSKDGRVLSARLLRTPQQARIAREVLQKVKEALFRPAFRKGRFVAGEIVMKYSVEVR